MAKKLSFKTKLLYSFGTLGFSMIDRIMVTWLMFYWVSAESGNTKLLKATVFGAIMVLGRIVDAIADPLVAQWSDRSTNPKGRRIPFMVWSGIIYVAIFIALYYPLFSSTLGNEIYLTLLLGGYFFIFTVYVTPYLGLLPELARSTKDRVDLSTLKAVFSLAGVALAMIVSGLLIAKWGFHMMIWVFGLVGIVALYLPVFIKERDYTDAPPATLGIVKAVTTTLQNRAFLIYLVGNVTFWFGFNIVTLAVPFYVTSLMGLDEGATTGLLAATFGVSILVFPVINLLSKKWGLKSMMATSLVLFAVLLPFIFFMNAPLFGLSPYIYGVILMGLIGIPLAGLFIVPDAIVAAVTDFEEKMTGQRREAMYFGTQGLILKVALGLSTFFTGLLMDIYGEPLGIQLTGPVGAFFVLIGLLVFLRYPEKEVRKMEKISC